MNSPSKLPPIIKDNLVLWFDPIYYTTAGGIIGIRDNSGNNNTLNSITSLTYSAGPPAGLTSTNTGLMIFNTTNSPTVFGTNDFTMSWWFNITTLPSNYIWFFESRISGGDTFGLGVSYSAGGNLAVSIAVNIQVNNPLKVNKWYQLTVLRISSVCFIYLNGLLLTSGAMSNNFTDNKFYIGQTLSSIASNTGLIGTWGQILIYKGLGLTQQQVTQNFNYSRTYYGV